MLILGPTLQMSWATNPGHNDPVLSHPANLILDDTILDSSVLLFWNEEALTSV